MVAAGSIVTYIVKYFLDPTAWVDPCPSQVEAKISPDLWARNLSIVSSDAGQHACEFGIQFGGVGGQLVLQVKLLGDFNQYDDVKAILDNEVYLVTGSLPVSSSISAIAPPGGGPLQQTGDPGAQQGAGIIDTVDTVLAAANTTVTNAAGGVTSLSSLLNPGTWGITTTVLIGLLAIVGLIIALFEFAPQGTARALKAARA